MRCFYCNNISGSAVCDPCARERAQQLSSNSTWSPRRSKEQVIILPTTRNSVFGRKLLAAINSSKSN